MIKITVLLWCSWLAVGLAAQEQVSLAEYQKALATIQQLRAEIAQLKRGEGEPPSVADVVSSPEVTQASQEPSTQAVVVALPIYTASEEVELTRLSAAEEAELNPQSRFDDTWLVGKHRIRVKQPLVSGDGNLVIKVRNTRAGGVGAGMCSILLVSNGEAQLRRYAVRDKKQFSFGGHYYRFAIEGAESKACLLSVQRRS